MNASNLRYYGLRAHLNNESMTALTEYFGKTVSQLGKRINVVLMWTAVNGKVYKRSRDIDNLK